MGTIVAAKTNQGLAIGADCLNTVEDLIHSSLHIADSCISKIGESYIGLNCSYALQQLSQAAFSQIPGEGVAEIVLSNKEQIQTFFINHLFHLKTQNQVIPGHNPNLPFETLPLNALVVNRHGIFKVDATRSIYENKKFWAIGTGEAFALGALQALYNEETDAESLVRSALKVCGVFEGNRSREITVKNIRLPNLKLAPAERSKDNAEAVKVLMHRAPVNIRRGKKTRKKDADSD